MEQSVNFSKFAGFLWHPLRKENQRWALRCDKKWVKLSSHWETPKKGNVIPLYMVDLPEASDVQKVVESMEQLQASKLEGLDQPYPISQQSTEPTLNEAGPNSQ